MSRDDIASVSRSIAALLSRVGQTPKAEWIAERIAVLEEPNSTPQVAETAVKELHGIVLGMGGLMDLWPVAPTPAESTAAQVELHRLADELYELTR